MTPSKASSLEKKPIIVCASDYVGHQVLDYLLARGEAIKALVLDRRDIGGHNGDMAKALQKASKSTPIYFDGDIEDPSLLPQIREAHLGILAWWPRILHGEVLTAPHLGWLNLHPSFLPHNRGKYPNVWAILDETPAGVSLHFIDERVDAGRLVSRRRIPVTWEDTGGSLYMKAREEIISLFKDTYDDIMAETVVPQDLFLGPVHYKEDYEPIACLNLDEGTTVKALLNRIRATQLYPGSTATFEDGGKRYSVNIRIRVVK